MGQRKIVLQEGCSYHAFSRSIAGFEIFRSEEEYRRVIEAFRFYQHRRPAGTLGLSFALKTAHSSQARGALCCEPALVRIIAYCVMPTHVHLLFEQKSKNGISEFMRLVLNSYSRYFNLKIKREGPLWRSRFKCVPVETDEQALHLTRYIHLNPSSAGLVAGPGLWKYSSYGEYIGSMLDKPICDFKRNINLDGLQYRKFAEDHIGYQRSLQLIKAQLLD